jgi:hypothetical protein
MMYTTGLRLQNRYNALCRADQLANLSHATDYNDTYVFWRLATSWLGVETNYGEHHAVEL